LLRTAKMNLKNADADDDNSTKISRHRIHPAAWLIEKPWGMRTSTT